METSSKESKKSSWQSRFQERMGTNTPEHISDWYEDATRRVPVNLEIAKKPVGQVFIIPNRCKECSYCWNYCPEDVLVMSENLNDKGYHYPTIASDKLEACVLCGFCQEICPDFHHDILTLVGSTLQKNKYGS